jgi:hypothetical protein
MESMSAAEDHDTPGVAVHGARAGHVALQSHETRLYGRYGQLMQPSVCARALYEQYRALAGEGRPARIVATFGMGETEPPTRSRTGVTDPNVATKICRALDGYNWARVSPWTLTTEVVYEAEKRPGTSPSHGSAPAAASATSSAAPGESGRVDVPARARDGDGVVGSPPVAGDADGSDAVAAVSAAAGTSTPTITTTVHYESTGTRVEHRSRAVDERVCFRMAYDRGEACLVELATQTDDVVPDDEVPSHVIPRAFRSVLTREYVPDPITKDCGWHYEIRAEWVGETRADIERQKLEGRPPCVSVTCTCTNPLVYNMVRENVKGLVVLAYMFKMLDVYNTVADAAFESEVSCTVVQ